MLSCWLAGIVGFPYDPVLMLGSSGLPFIGSLMLTAIGALLSARIKQGPSAMSASQLVMMFLSVLAAVIGVVALSGDHGAILDAGDDTSDSDTSDNDQGGAPPADGIGAGI